MGVEKIVEAAVKPPAAKGEDGNRAPTWIKYVAMLTGGLAAVAGYLTVHSTVLSNEAIYHSNQGVLFQAQASDAWNEYQADSIKAHVVETALETATDATARQHLEDEDKTLRSRQPTAKQKALDLEARRDAELVNSGKNLGERDVLQYAGMAIQLGIAVASVAALTRIFSLFMIGGVSGMIGVAITVYAWYIHYMPK